MLAKTITYTDYKGVERTEEFLFDLSEAEILEAEMKEEGGLSALMQKVVKASDTPTLITLFKRLIMWSYGEVSADGRRFVKSEEISKAFTQTPAYNKLFMELATDEKAAAEFVNNIVPKEAMENAKKLASKE